MAVLWSPTASLTQNLGHNNYRIYKKQMANWE